MDGLEWKLIEKWNLTHLKQKVYGTYPNPSLKFSSAYLWAAFLTGQPMEKFNVKFVKYPIKSPVNIKLLKSIAKKLIKPKPDSIKGKYKTIFESIPNSFAYNVFMYNEEMEQFRLRLKYPLIKLVGNEELSLQAYNEWVILTFKLFHEFIEKIKVLNPRLAMTHIFLPDIVGHTLYYKRGKLRLVYELMDSFVQVINELFNPDVLLVVSDHGMEKGEHTPYGFYSLNFETEWKPKAITDFYWKIVVGYQICENHFSFL